VLRLFSLLDLAETTFLCGLRIALFLRLACGSLSELVLEDGFPALLVLARALL